MISIECDREILTKYRKRLVLLKRVFGIAFSQSIVGNTVQIEEDAIKRVNEEITAHEKNIKLLELFIAKGVLTF